MPNSHRVRAPRPLDACPDTGVRFSGVGEWRVAGPPGPTLPSPPQLTLVACRPSLGRAAPGLNVLIRPRLFSQVAGLSSSEQLAAYLSPSLFCTRAARPGEEGLAAGGKAVLFIADMSAGWMIAQEILSRACVMWG